MDEAILMVEGAERLRRGPRFIERPMPLNHYKILASRLFREAFEAERLDPLPHSTLLGWRITRLLALDMNLMVPEETLREALNGKSWVDVSWCGLPPNEYLPPILADRGSGIVPWGSNNEQFAVAIDHIAGVIGARRGTKRHPYGNRAAINYWQLDQPGYLHYLYPNKHEIMEFEELLLADLVDQVVAGTHHRFLQETQQEYGLTWRECDNLIKCVHNQLAKYADQDTYIAKGLLVARIESIAQRAKEAGDIRAELNAVKALAVLHNVVQNTGGRSTNEDFIEAVRHITAIEDTKSKMPIDVPAQRVLEDTR